jgi:hypothetical protein
VKAISLLQPWASMIALGHKRVETRSWATTYRGPLAIHASRGQRDGREFHQAERDAGKPLTPLPYGAIVAVVRLAGIARTEQIRGQLDAKELELGDYTPGRFGWILEDITPLPTPIPCAGALSLWEVPEKIADAVSLAVFDQMKPRSP